MASLSRYGRDVATVFDLLGTHEPALTGAFGWTLTRSAHLMEGVLRRLGLTASHHDVAVQLEVADELGRTDIELRTPSAHIIIEAKQGWIVPGEMQLSAYASRFVTAMTAKFDTRLVTLSDSTQGWAREVLPAEVGGVSVTHWSWDDMRDLIRESRQAARGIERLWLDQMEEYMGAATSKRPVTDALAYCVVISNDRFGGVSFRDYVEKQRVYFHPVAGGGWPSVPPNFLAFRWGNAVRQVNRVENYEIVPQLADRFPDVEGDESASSRPPWGAYVIYELGPDIPLPNGAIPSGPSGVNLRAQRFWVLLDQLLTQPTVVDARDATRALGAT